MRLVLAARLDCGVHLKGDFFRRSIVSGRVEMTPDGSAEAVEQLRLHYRLVAAADTYSQAGLTVVLEDVTAGQLLDEYRTSIRSRPCHVVVVMLSLEALVERKAPGSRRGRCSRSRADPTRRTCRLGRRPHGPELPHALATWCGAAAAVLDSRVLGSGPDLSR
jgi:hypothetical protein